MSEEVGGAVASRCMCDLERYERMQDEGLQGQGNGLSMRHMLDSRLHRAV